MRFGYGPSLLAAVLSVLAFDFFFVPPYFSFAVTDSSHIVTFSVMFIVAVVISHLTKRFANRPTARADASATRQASTRSAASWRCAQSRASLLATATRHVREVFDAKVAVLLPGRDGRARARACRRGNTRPGRQATSASPTGCGSTSARPAPGPTRSLPPARSSFRSRARAAGSASSRSSRAAPRLGSADGAAAARHLREPHRLGARAHAACRRGAPAALRIETEQLRNALLSSVSHDLRTPLGRHHGGDERAPRRRRSGGRGQPARAARGQRTRRRCG